MLKIKNISCQKGYNQLFSNLSFTINTGDIIRITGVNGSGKTSLLRMLAGINKPSDGNIFFNNWAINSDDYQQQILYLGHQSLINEKLSAYENLNFLHKLHNDEPVDYCNALYNIGLQNYIDEYCYLLSAGQKRRVILASLFISNKKIWLLDEPFTALDVNGVQIIEDIISKHCNNNGICIFTTHQATKLRFKEIAL